MNRKASGAGANAMSERRAPGFGFGALLPTTLAAILLQP
jgi:hypothetical protein